MNSPTLYRPLPGYQDAIGEPDLHKVAEIFAAYGMKILVPEEA